MRSVRPDNVESEALKLGKVGEKFQTPVVLLAKEGGIVRLAMEIGELRCKRTCMSGTQFHHDVEGLSYRSINDKSPNSVVFEIWLHTRTDLQVKQRDRRPRRWSDLSSRINGCVTEMCRT